MDAGIAIARLDDIPDEHGDLNFYEQLGEIAQQQLDITIPDAIRARIICLRCEIARDATAGTRRAQIDVILAGQTLLRLPSRAGHAVAATVTYQWTEGATESFILPITLQINNKLPALRLPPTAILRATILAPGPNDTLVTFSAITEEWING